MSKRYELSIKPTYLPGWDIYTACREIIQNARDAEIQDSSEMSVTYATRQRDGNKIGAVVITSTGVTLSKQSLLLGHTTKVGDSRLIGQFGEGYKLALMVLCRLGVDVKIRNGSEVWIPSISYSKTYDSDVLCIDVTTGHKDENRVQFDILGVDEDVWETIKQRLLFLGEYPEHIPLKDGNILTSAHNKGKVFVKGMFVAKTESTFGYDFKNADIDRDRRMISDFQDKSANLLADAVNQGFLAAATLNMMSEGSTETSYLTSYRLTEDGRKGLKEEFLRKYGSSCIPVENNSQADELAAFGKKGVVVGWNLRSILESVMGDASAVLKELRSSCRLEYDVSELNNLERGYYNKALSLVSNAIVRSGGQVLNPSNVLIVEFNKPDLLGTYDPKTDTIRLARKILTNPGKLIYTLVHEAAHVHGGDGFVTHEKSIGNICEEVLNALLA